MILSLLLALCLLPVQPASQTQQNNLIDLYHDSSTVVELEPEQWARILEDDSVRFLPLFRSKFSQFNCVRRRPIGLYSFIPPPIPNAWSSTANMRYGNLYSRMFLFAFY